MWYILKILFFLFLNSLVYASALVVQAVISNAYSMPGFYLELWLVLQSAVGIQP